MLIICLFTFIAMGTDKLKESKAKVKSRDKRNLIKNYKHYTTLAYTRVGHVFLSCSSSQKSGALC
jgi:hypothetical protein